MENLKLLQKNKRKKKTSAELYLEVNEKVKPIEKKKRKREKGVNMEAAKEVMREDEENDKIKPIGKMIKKRGKGNNVNTGKVVQEGKRVKTKALKKKRNHDEKNNSLVGKSDKKHEHDDGSEDKSPSENQGNNDIFKKKTEASDGTKARTRKSKKSKKRKMEHGISQECKNVLEKKDVEDDAYCISSGEEDCSNGMTKYHQRRPSLKELQQRIDDFMSAHEEKLEQERKEREAEAEKDGWTVVVHHKGRKKTTDSESGITVGSVAPAVAHKLGTAKKHKEVNLEFYRFKKRESQRNEILALQSKFEQEKKRIQQLRAARKFKPY